MILVSKEERILRLVLGRRVLLELVAQGRTEALCNWTFLGVVTAVAFLKIKVFPSIAQLIF